LFRKEAGREALRPRELLQHSYRKEVKMYSRRAEEVEMERSH